MSRFLSLSSQRFSSGRLTRCVSCLESLCVGAGASGMNEVRLALSISRAFSTGCSSVDPLNLTASLRRSIECDEHDGCAAVVKGRALGITVWDVQRGKDLIIDGLLDSKSIRIHLSHRVLQTSKQWT